MAEKGSYRYEYMENFDSEHDYAPPILVEKTKFPLKHKQLLI